MRSGRPQRDDGRAYHRAKGAGPPARGPTGWLDAEIRGWTLAETMDQTQYALLQAAAGPALRAFIQAGGTMASFPHPAHVVTAVKT